MEEIYQITAALKHLSFGKQVAVLTDARFSGVSTGACIGHVGPEALAGGPIGQRPRRRPDPDRRRPRQARRVDRPGRRATASSSAPRRGARVLAERSPHPDALARPRPARRHPPLGRPAGRRRRHLGRLRLRPRRHHPRARGQPGHRRPRRAHPEPAVNPSPARPIAGPDVWGSVASSRRGGRRGAGGAGAVTISPLNASTTPSTECFDGMAWGGWGYTRHHRSPLPRSSSGRVWDIPPMLTVSPTGPLTGSLARWRTMTKASWVI